MLDRLTYSFFKRKYILRNIVGKVAVLAVIPDLLDRIKLRRISRKPFNINTPGKAPTQPSLCPTLNQPALENQDNTSRKVSQKQQYKFFKIIDPDVAILNRKVQIQSMRFRRNADCRNCRKPISSVPAIVNRCFSFWCPGATNSWLKHKTAFIDQYGGSVGSTGFFLYEANPSFARILWPVRCVLWLASRAFGNSNPSFAEFARHVRYDNLHQNVSVSTLRYAVGSTSRFCSHLLWGLLREAFEVLTVACRTVCMALTAAVNNAKEDIVKEVKDATDLTEYHNETAT